MHSSDTNTESGESDWLLRVGKPPLDLTIGGRSVVTDQDLWEVVLQILDAYDVHLKNPDSGLPVGLVGPKDELKKINERYSSLESQKFKPNT